MTDFRTWGLKALQYINEIILNIFLNCSLIMGHMSHSVFVNISPVQNNMLNVHFFPRRCILENTMLNLHMSLPFIQ